MLPQLWVNAMNVCEDASMAISILQLPRSMIQTEESSAACQIHRTNKNTKFNQKPANTQNIIKSFIKFFPKTSEYSDPPFFGTGRFDEYLETPKQPPAYPGSKKSQRSNRNNADLNGCCAWREVKQGQLTEAATWTYPRMPFV